MHLASIVFCFQTWLKTLLASRQPPPFNGKATIVMRKREGLSNVSPRSEHWMLSLDFVISAPSNGLVGCV